MSWETLVVGHLKFKNNVENDIKEKILKEAKDVFECEIKWDAERKKYAFQDVNWVSHVNEEEITAFFKQYGKFFDNYSVSLYYLTEPYCNWYNEGDIPCRQW